MARLDGFLAEATWAGTAVATASWSVGSLASVFSGVTPALHGAAHPARPSLRPSVPTLAEELASAGFATRGYFSSPWLGPGFGMDRGFQSLRRLRRGAGERWLAGLDGDPSFTWIQLGLPGPTLVAAPAAATADGDPTRRRLAEADRRLGRLLGALRRSGRWEESVVIVVGDHGEAMADAGPPLPGSAIGRASVEVPLGVLLPAGLAGRLRIAPGEVVGLDRLFATVIELEGARPHPAAAPSLLRSTAWVGRSELWFANGYHELALHEDGHQLRWRCRFAPADPEFGSARAEAGVGTGSVRYGAMIEDLESGFRRHPGCSLGEEVALERWLDDGGVLAVDEPPRRDRMLERLRRLRSFPPPWSLEPSPPAPALDRRRLRALAGWGLPIPGQWAAREVSPRRRRDGQEVAPPPGRARRLAPMKSR
jgi:hypothetical protein